MDYLSLEFWDKGRLLPHGLISSVISAYWAIESDGRELKPSDEPLWVLGVLYDTRTELEAACNDIVSRVWLTYRRGFPALSDGSTTTDRGWGCMLRCGQMLLAEAGIRRHLGRAWRWSSDCRDPLYLKLMSMFQDQPLAPFSLHVMTSLGQHTGKSIGEWYGPNTVAHLIRRLPEFDVWNNFVVSVVQDHVLFVDETRELSKKSHPNGWDPLLILIPLRLGVDLFNPAYTEPLQKFFQMPQSLGILGGTPSHALFLIGYVGNDVIFLDPHTTQDFACVGDKEAEEQMQADYSYHCRTTPHMPFNRLDPSMALCFLCNSELEYTDLLARLRANLTLEGATAAATVLLEVMDTRPDFMKDVLEEDSVHDSSRLSSSFIVLSDDSDNMEHGKDGDCLEDSSGKTVTDADKVLPQKFEISGDVRKSLRTARMDSENNQTDASMIADSEICIGIPAQDSDRSEEEWGEQWSQIGRNSSESSKSSTEEPFEFL